MDSSLQHTIDNYLAGNLSAQEIDELWADLIDQPEAYTYLKIAANAKQLAPLELNEEEREQSAQEPATVYTWRHYMPWVATAAVLLLTITVLFNIKMSTDASFEGLSEINISKLEDSEVLRSSDDFAAADSLLQVGLTASLDGRTDRSKSAYLTIIRRYKDSPASAKAYLNLGILEYNSGKYEDASTHFTNAAEQSNRTLIKEKAYWYQANAYLNLNRLEEARTAARNAYTQNGDYRRLSFILLKKLDSKLNNTDNSAVILE